MLPWLFRRQHILVSSVHGRGSLKMAAKLGAAPPLLLWLLCAQSSLHHRNYCFQKLLPSVHISKPRFLFLLLNLIFFFIKAPDLSHSSVRVSHHPLSPFPRASTSGLLKCSLEPMICVYNSVLLRILQSAPCSSSVLAHSSHSLLHPGDAQVTLLGDGGAT